MKGKVRKVISPRKKLAAVISIALLVAIVSGYWAITTSSRKPVHDTSKVVTYSTDKPDETKPDKNFAWKGGPKDPKKITIPTIGVEAYIQKVGIDQNKEVAVPTNLFLVGWFVDTVRPGEKGLSLIDGHVTGRQNDGVFKDLDKLNKGDKYSVELGGGTSLSYEVVDKKSTKTKESLSIMFSQDPSISNQLNLVTCSGNFDQKTRTYDERLTIISKQL